MPFISLSLCLFLARMRRGGDSDSDDEQGEDDLNSLMDKMG